MPPLISRCLCLNLESEIIPSSDRFQDQSQQVDLLWGDPKMRKGLLFAQRTPFREKDFYFCEKDFYYG